MAGWVLAGCVIVLPNLLQLVGGHGRLIEPPSRATMWRYGFDTPPNYNDHELYCGGYARQWQKNNGKCGVCGDAYDMPKPRPNEAGGKYGNGIIVRKYRMNKMINVRVEITVNHKGHFEMRMCPHNSPHRVVTQDCLDKYLLQIAKKGDGGTYGDESMVQHDTRFYPGPGNKVFEVKYMLPENLTCSQCVVQWRYFAGNNWGTCPNGTGHVGCGPQEEFRACSDVAVVDSSGVADETPFDNEIPTDEEADKPGHEGGVAGEEESAGWWLILVIIACTTLLLLLAVFLFIYVYFYKKDSLKEWWENRQVSTISHNGQNKQLRFWGTFMEGNTKFKFWRSNSVEAEKEKNYSIPQPTPPPRTKKINRTLSEI